MRKKVLIIVGCLISFVIFSGIMTNSFYSKDKVNIDIISKSSLIAKKDNCSNNTCNNLSTSKSLPSTCSTDEYTKGNIKDPNMNCILNACNEFEKNKYDYSDKYNVNTKICKIYCRDEAEFYLPGKVTTYAGMQFKYNLGTASESSETKKECNKGGKYNSTTDKCEYDVTYVCEGSTTSATNTITCDTSAKYKSPSEQCESGSTYVKNDCSVNYSCRYGGSPNEVTGKCEYDPTYKSGCKTNADPETIETKVGCDVNCPEVAIADTSQCKVTYECDSKEHKLSGTTCSYTPTTNNSNNTGGCDKQCDNTSGYYESSSTCKYECNSTSHKLSGTTCSFDATPSTDTKTISCDKTCSSAYSGYSYDSDDCGYKCGDKIQDSAKCKVDATVTYDYKYPKCDSCPSDYEETYNSCAKKVTKSERTCSCTIDGQTGLWIFTTCKWESEKTSTVNSSSCKSASPSCLKVADNGNVKVSCSDETTTGMNICRKTNYSCSQGTLNASTKKCEYTVSKTGSKKCVKTTYTCPKGTTLKGTKCEYTAKQTGVRTCTKTEYKCSKGSYNSSTKKCEYTAKKVTTGKKICKKSGYTCKNVGGELCDTSSCCKYNQTNCGSWNYTNKTPYCATGNYNSSNKKCQYDAEASYSGTITCKKSSGGCVNKPTCPKGGSYNSSTNKCEYEATTTTNPTNNGSGLTGIVTNKKQCTSEIDYDYWYSEYLKLLNTKVETTLIEDPIYSCEMDLKEKVKCSVGEYSYTSKKCEYDANVTTYCKKDADIKYTCQCQTVNGYVPIKNVYTDNDCTIKCAGIYNFGGSHNFITFSYCPESVEGLSNITKSETTCYAEADEEKCPSGWSLNEKKGNKGHDYSCVESTPKHTLSGTKCSYNATKTNYCPDGTEKKGNKCYASGQCGSEGKTIATCKTSGYTYNETTKKCEKKEFVLNYGLIDQWLYDLYNCNLYTSKDIPNTIKEYINATPVGTSKDLIISQATCTTSDCMNLTVNYEDSTYGNNNVLSRKSKVLNSDANKSYYCKDSSSKKCYEYNASVDNEISGSNSTVNLDYISGKIPVPNNTHAKVSIKTENDFYQSKQYQAEVLSGKVTIGDGSESTQTPLAENSYPVSNNTATGEYNIFFTFTKLPFKNTEETYKYSCKYDVYNITVLYDCAVRDENGSIDLTKCSNDCYEVIDGVPVIKKECMKWETAKNKQYGFVYRTVELNNLFPNAVIDGNGISTRKGKTNWSDQIETIEEIQNSASTIFTNDNEYLQYRYVLTPKSIQEIKAYNKNEITKGGYNNNTLVDCERVKVGNVYLFKNCKSTFLKEIKNYTGVQVGGTKGGVN